MINRYKKFCIFALIRAGKGGNILPHRWCNFVINKRKLPKSSCNVPAIFETQFILPYKLKSYKVVNVVLVGPHRG